MSKTIFLAILILTSIMIPFFVIFKTTYSATPTTSEDYQLWVQPYLANIESVREVIMTPYTPQGSGTGWGYSTQYGLYQGGGIEPAPAIGVGNGYNNVIVISDNNIEGGLSMDYWNSPQSVLTSLSAFSNFNNANYGVAVYPTNFNSQVRSFNSMTWYGVGACSGPSFTAYQYPSSFNQGGSTGYLLDRREAEYGFIGPYASILIQPGVHIGGIGSNCGTEGQTWYVSSYGGFTNGISTQSACQPSSATPCIVTEFPSNKPAQLPGDDTGGFVVMEYYMQCVSGTASCSLWQNALKIETAADYPFTSTRGAAHFIEAVRATGAWTMSNMSYDGMPYSTLLQNTITSLWSQGQDSNGGMKQNWDANDGGLTGEPNMQVLTAFNPNLPSWFVPPTGTTSSSSTTSHTTTSTTSISHTTSTSTTHTATSTTTTQSTTTTSASSTTSATSHTTSSTSATSLAPAINAQQPTSALVWGGFATFETFLVGLALLSILESKGVLISQRVNRSRQW
jgi:hypothetical protein